MRSTQFRTPGVPAIPHEDCMTHGGRHGNQQSWKKEPHSTRIHKSAIGETNVIHNSRSAPLGVPVNSLCPSVLGVRRRSHYTRPHCVAVSITASSLTFLTYHDQRLQSRVFLTCVLTVGSWANLGIENDCICARLINRHKKTDTLRVWPLAWAVSAS